MITVLPVLTQKILFFFLNLIFITILQQRYESSLFPVGKGKDSLPVLSLALVGVRNLVRFPSVTSIPASFVKIHLVFVFEQSFLLMKIPAVMWTLRLAFDIFLCRSFLSSIITYDSFDGAVSFACIILLRIDVLIQFRR